MTKINISIPQPCHENWEAMAPQDKGRFCDACQKKVFDFTNASDREIVEAFRQNKNLCGRFQDSQLNRDLVKPERKNPVWLAVSATVISLLGVQVATAQKQVKIEQTSKKHFKKKAGKIGDLVTVAGKVLTESGSPITGISLQIKGIEITQTDANGEFNIEAVIGDNLEFINQNDRSDIFLPFQVMEEGRGLVFQQAPTVTIEGYTYTKKVHSTVGGVVRVTATPIKKRTFFGRIFHAIGNIFR